MCVTRGTYYPLSYDYRGWLLAGSWCDPLRLQRTISRNLNTSINKSTLFVSFVKVEADEGMPSVIYTLQYHLSATHCAARRTNQIAAIDTHLVANATPPSPALPPLALDIRDGLEPVISSNWSHVLRRKQLSCVRVIVEARFGLGMYQPIQK